VFKRASIADMNFYDYRNQDKSVVTVIYNITRGLELAEKKGLSWDDMMHRAKMSHICYYLKMV